MVRKITLLFAAAILWVGSISLQAAGEPTALVVKLKDGTEVQFITSENLVVSNSGSDVVFKSTTASATYPRSNVAKFYFKPVGQNSVEKVKDDRSTNFLMLGDYIIITSTETLTMPMVYNLNGQKLAAHVEKISSNSSQISISSLQKGIYIITANRQSFKFIKR